MKSLLAIIILAFTASVFAETAPTEFVTQVLEPTRAKISRAKDWFYAERHRGPVYEWIISREDTHGGSGPYTTGVRIRLFTSVKQNTKKSAQEFILSFLAAKKREATTKVIRTGDEKEQGHFTRICLETEEGGNHVLYSLLWSNDMDVAVHVIAGTSNEHWDTYSPTFNKMSAFEYMDMTPLVKP